jgi:hypothetical protein
MSLSMFIPIAPIPAARAAAKAGRSLRLLLPAWFVDRLCRSLQDLVATLQDLRGAGVERA